MPFLDWKRAKREVFASEDNWTVEFSNGERHSFPTSLPAAVEFEQAAAEREQKRRKLDSIPMELYEAVVQAAYGPRSYEQLVESGVSTIELMATFGIVMRGWMEPLVDPTRLDRLREWASQPGQTVIDAEPATPTPTVTSSDSSSTGPSSRPTSPASTESTLPRPSGQPLMVAGRELVPGAFGRSSQDSAARP